MRRARFARARGPNPSAPECRASEFSAGRKGNHRNTKTPKIGITARTKCAATRTTGTLLIKVKRPAPHHAGLWPRRVLAAIVGLVRIGFRQARRPLLYVTGHIQQAVGAGPLRISPHWYSVPLVTLFSIAPLRVPLIPPRKNAPICAPRPPISNFSCKMAYTCQLSFEASQVFQGNATRRTALRFPNHARYWWAKNAGPRVCLAAKRLGDKEHGRRHCAGSRAV